MASFYIWITVVILVIVLLAASAISKITYDRRRTTRRIVSRQIDVETVHSGNNTVIYTIPATQIGGRRPNGEGNDASIIFPDQTMTVTRSRTMRITELDDCPPSYDQVVQTPPTRSAA